jgi:hypothetical protein
LTVTDSVLTYLEHALQHFGCRHVARTAPFLWDFCDQFGDLPLTEVREGHVLEFVRQPKEGPAGVTRWPAATRRRAAHGVRDALLWGTALMGLDDHVP